MNPALDVSTSTGRVYSGHKLRCAGTRIDPGGGGVNVARVVQLLGGLPLAIFTAGGPTGDAYRRLVETGQLPAVVVPVRGSTRQDFTVEEDSTAKQFRFVLEGAELSGDEWRICLRVAARTMPAGGYFVASGSLPPGVPQDFYARIARLARRAGAKCVLDSSGPPLAEALAEGVFLVKPSRRELGEHLGTVLGSEGDLVEAARMLLADGSAACVALTLGEDGAVLASTEGTVRFPAPRVKVVSTVGAGDSFVGAMVLRLAQGRPLEAAFAAGVAAGSATAMTPATELCHRRDVERLEAELIRSAV
jgi:6-phosphofructokinase 2